MGPAVGPRLRRLLGSIAVVLALLVANSIYLFGVRAAGALAGGSAETPFSLGMLLAHVVVGLAVALPFALFVLLHARRARQLANRRAARIGTLLAAASGLVIATGVLLTRIEGILELRDPALRQLLFGVHLVTPVAAAALYLLHRRRGVPLPPRAVLRWTAVAAALLGATIGAHLLANRRAPEPDEAATRENFFPSLARTRTGGHLDAGVLMADDYCKRCHEDAHATWSVSAHRFSSFNNPAYRFSVLETRRVVTARDGNLQASRWCAGCHDPVPLFSGRFDRPDFDPDSDPTANAGLTCISCHAIERIDSVRGNGAYTIDAPAQYPFAFSASAALRWLSRQLVRARPELHRRTFLKPFHRSAEFCSTCHKVHLPPELNHDRWLRGQNHYDSYRLAGVSGHSASSFYYPQRAFSRCAECHMPLQPSSDFGARDFDGAGRTAIHDHQFVGANVGLGALVGWPETALEKHRQFLSRALRVDLFALRRGNRLESPLAAPLRPLRPALVPGESYLFEVVVRNLLTGHEFTQGTADSNEVWLEVSATSGDRLLGINGALAADRSVEPRSYFLNAWVLDRLGRRIDRRNPQDIYTVLFNHQIPPGSATVVPYRLTLPHGLTEPVTVRARARYRKFDNTFVRHFRGAEAENDTPIVELAGDSVTLPIAGATAALAEEPEPATPLWQRWNDYGIGLLRQSGPMARGALAAATNAFEQVEALGRPDGPLNLVRAYLGAGEEVSSARAALERAARFDPPAAPWLLAWFEAQVARREGRFEEAIAALGQLIATPWAEARERGFDFAGDDRVWLLLGQLELERAQAFPAGNPEFEAGLGRAAEAFERALAADPENSSAHYSLARVRRGLGDAPGAARELAAFERFRGDDPERDRARDAARRANVVADQLAEPVVIFDLLPQATEVAPAASPPIAAGRGLKRSQGTAVTADEPVPSTRVE